MKTPQIDALPGMTPLGLKRSAPAQEPKNLILRAAAQDDIDAASWLLQEALGVGTGDLAGYHLPAPTTWKTLNQRDRLAYIGDWLRAEALSLIQDDPR